jgi:hypothetical protein
VASKASHKRGDDMLERMLHDLENFREILKELKMQGNDQPQAELHINNAIVEVSKALRILDPDFDKVA